MSDPKRIATSIVAARPAFGTRPRNVVVRVVSVSSVAVTLFAGAARGDTPPAHPTPAALVDLGRALFFDARLSEPEGTSCASCHDPARAFSGINGSTLGVPRGSRAGHYARRTAPSLLYLKYVPSFRFYQEGDDPTLAPFGGLFWDGRVDSVSALARQPLLNPDEMNDRDGGVLAAKIRREPYAAAFESAFGTALGSPEATLAAVGSALEAFLTTDQMAPFSSRFDAFVRHRSELTPLEREGLRLFEDPSKGACSGCHTVSENSGDPAASLFTDFGYDAAGAPRNGKVPSRKPDLGLCERTDRSTPTSAPEYCAQFRTPSLRNVAVRASFMHDGTFTRLRDVVAFYASRDTDPRRWYPSGIKFDDLPPRYRGQVNVTTPPYNRRPGDPPALSEHEIDAVVAFLGTLTDQPPAR